MKKLLTIAAIALLAACTKDNKPSCEKWEVKKTCEPKQWGVVCANPIEWTTENVCGDKLKDAKPGNTVVYFENDNIKRSITYIRKAS